MNFKYFILFIGIFSSTFGIFAHENLYSTSYRNRFEQSEIPQTSKVYIQPDQIHIHMGNLFVELNGRLHQVSQICQDEIGLYVPHCEFWVFCANGHPNPPWRFTCQVCGLALY